MDVQWTDPVPFDDLPRGPGLIKIVLRPGSCLLGRDGECVGPGNCLYVGATNNLRRRIFDEHFKTGASGKSATRRSLGAILKPFLDLRAVPRPGRSGHKDCVNYMFEGCGEDRLTTWMKKRLLVSVCEAPEDCLKTLKKTVSAQLQPALDARDPNNPHGELIRRLRHQCIDEACVCP